VMSVSTSARLARRRRKMITYGWIGGLAALTIALIYWEQTALLYILATVGVTILLVIVALADLAHAESMKMETAPVDRNDRVRR
jgi:hypothetical protein